jgi:hypothetical protein
MIYERALSVRAKLKRHWNHHVVKDRQIPDIGSRQTFSREHLKRRFEISDPCLGPAEAFSKGRCYSLARST